MRVTQLSLPRALRRWLALSGGLTPLPESTNLLEDSWLAPASDTGARRLTLLASASWTFGTQIAVAALSLGNVLIVSRWLGPTGRGDIVFLMTIASLSAQLASLSIDHAAANIAGRYPERRRAVGGNLILFSLVLGALAIGLLVGLFVAFPGIAPRVSIGLRAAMLAAIPPLILFTYLSRLVFADFGVGVFNISSLITPGGSIVANGALAAAGVLSVASAFSVWLIGQLAALLLLAWYVERRLAGFGRPNLRLGRQMISFGLKAYGGRALQLGNYRLDQWLVGAISGSRELGLYSVAVAWSEGLFILPRAAMEAQRPFLIRAERRSAGAQAGAVFRLATIVTAPAALAVVILAPFLCVTIFGSEFRGAIADLRVLAFGALGIGSMKILGSALIAQNKPLLDGLATGAAFVATLVLDLLLIPSHAGLGAAYASTIAYTVGGVGVAVIAAHTLRFPILSLLPRGSDISLAARVGARLVRRLLGRHIENEQGGAGSAQV
jgi:O-antigen/teichoic acid export membrane protein